MAKTDWTMNDTVMPEDMNDIGLEINELQGQMAHADPIDVTLSSGIQIIKSEVETPLNVMSLKGRTLVNLLGRVGNCESTAGFLAAGVSISVNTADAVIGKASINMTATLNTPIEHYAVLGAELADGGSAPIEPNSYYLLVGKVKPVLGQASLRYIIFDSTGTALTDKITSKASDTTKWTTIITKFQTPNNAWRSEVRAQVYNASGDASYIASGENANFDGIRLYRVTQSEYNSIDSMSEKQIEIKYPYVDDMKPIVNPYVIRYGKNLLPPFTEWYGSIGGDARYSYPVGKYKFKIEPRPEGAEPFVINYRFTVPIVPGESYTYSCTHNGKIAINLFDADMVRITNHGLPNVDMWLTDQLITFTAPLNARYANILIGNNGFETLGCEFSNPMFNIGHEPLPFVPREDNMQVAITSLASNVDGSVYDELFQKDGRLYKFGRFKTIELDGNLTWTVGSESPGFKRVVAALPSPSLRVNDGWFVKFNGNVLKRFSGAYDSADIGYHDTINVVITIPNEDSGWGDSYRPSNDEVKGYFNGWRMFQEGSDAWTSIYTSGTKWWVNRSTGTTTKTPNFEEVVWDTTNAFGKGSQTPYKLQYQLAIPTLEEVQSEGQISLHEGANQVEVGAGMVIRESVTPKLSDGGNVYTINYGFPGYESKLKNRVDSFLGIYKNDKIDSWKIVPNPSAYGRFMAEIDNGKFDITSAYSVTYTVLDKYLLTGPVTAIDYQYPSNTKSIVDTLVSGQVDVVRRVGVLEMQKAGKYQPQWIDATMVNGWIRFDAGYYPIQYMKDSAGFVHLRGLVKNGVTTQGTLIFNLPKGYRPAGFNAIGTLSRSGSTPIPCSLQIAYTGAVTIASLQPGTDALYFDGITFLAEN